MQRKLLARVFQKMRRVAVGFESGIINVLLIDKKTARVAAMTMHNIHEAAWFFARLRGQNLEDLCSFFLVAGFSDPDYGKNNHF